MEEAFGSNDGNVEDDEMISVASPSTSNRPDNEEMNDDLNDTRTSNFSEDFDEAHAATRDGDERRALNKGNGEDDDDMVAKSDNESEGGDDEQGNNIIPAISANTGSAPFDRRSRLLEDTPSATAIDLSKLPGSSWGVCLVKEGEDCIVGRASEVADGRDSSQHLRCGDMILYAQNDNGDEASSRLSAWLTPELAGQDYYRAMVDLFKKSEKLQLVVQRV